MNYDMQPAWSRTKCPRLSEGKRRRMMQAGLEILRDPLRVFTCLCWASAVSLTLLLGWMAVASVQQVRSDGVYVEGLQRQAAKAQFISQRLQDASR